MFNILRELCEIDGTSGDEARVRERIIDYIDGFCDWNIDALGNIIAFKKGKNRAKKRVLIDAHTDEVGLIISSVTADGFLKFHTVGGIDTAVLLSRRVKIGDVYGVVGCKPIHLAEKSETEKLPKINSLYIDIGAKSKEEALKMVSLGDRAVMESEWIDCADKIKMKALDDRIGCAILITLIREESEYDFCATFSVQEEVGTRGAKTAAFTVDPESCIVLEGTTAADIAGVEDSKRVCVLGKGAAISFMDNGTVYDRDYYNAALSSGIICQAKAAVSGGNNSGAIHLSRGGVRTIAISAPCRYIHSASSVADKRDIRACLDLARYMLNGICSGTIK